jgi:HK97 family phage portal protein
VNINLPWRRNKKINSAAASERKSGSFIGKSADSDWLVYGNRKTPDYFFENVWNVYRCVSVVAQSIATLPFGLYRRQNKDDAEIPKHPLLDILAHPNGLQSREDFLEAVASYFLISGNSFTRIIGTRQRPAALLPLNPADVEVKAGPDLSMPIAGYVWSDEGKQTAVPYDEMLWVKSFNAKGFMERGLSRITVGQNVIEGQAETETWNKSLVQNSASPSGMLAGDSQIPMNDNDWELTKRRLKEQYTGAKNAGRPMLSEMGWKWYPFSFSPKDMDWLASKKMAIRDIATMFGVPSQLMGDTEASTYANYREARRALYTETVLPLARLKVFSPLSSFFFPDNSHYLKIDVSQIEALQRTTQEKVQGLDVAWWLTQNERRAEMGYDPLPDPRMDEIIFPPGAMPSSAFGQNNEGF